MGVSFVALATLVPFLHHGAVELAQIRFANTGELPAFELAIHIALATSMWLLIASLFGTRRSRMNRQLRLPTGTAMTETLIALPVCLLLIFGIGQMAVNNIAGIFADLAAFQSGRAVWVWYPEWQAGRADTDRGQVEEMARIQAAAVLVPVAPGDFAVDAGTGDAPNVARALGMLYGRHNDAGGSDVGRASYDEAAMHVRSAGDGGSSGRFSRALDESTFKTRTARKFAAAFSASEVELLDRANEVGVRLTYNHLNVFPLVGAVFGQRAEHGGRGGYYAPIVREFTLPTQVTPNARMPLR
jgi:hypothetical protein